MKKIRLYIPNVLLTFLVVFSLLGTELALFAKNTVLNAATFRTVAEQQDLKSKAYSSLETTFKSKANSTGIPAEVFLDPMDKEALHEGILDSVSQAFDYLNGVSDDYDFTMDFTELENSITTFFEDYAAEIGYKKDAAYDEKVASVIKDAESEVLFVVDTFKFSTMHRNGWLSKIRGYLAYLNPAVLGCAVLTIVLLLLLIFCNRKQLVHLAYWCGLAAMISGLMLLVPCIYLTATDYFTAFALKDPQIFAAVVGFLQLLTGRALTMAAVTLVCGIVLLVVFGIIQPRTKSNNEKDC